MEFLSFLKIQNYGKRELRGSLIRDAKFSAWLFQKNYINLGENNAFIFS